MKWLVWRLAICMSGAHKSMQHKIFGQPQSKGKLIVLAAAITHTQTHTHQHMNAFRRGSN